MGLSEHQKHERVKQYRKDSRKRNWPRISAYYRRWREANKKRNDYGQMKLRQQTDELRHCQKCGITMLIGNFNIDRAMSDGFDTICRKCRKKLKKFYAYGKKKREANAALAPTTVEHAEEKNAADSA